MHEQLTYFYLIYSYVINLKCHNIGIKMVIEKNQSIVLVTSKTERWKVTQTFMIQVTAQSAQSHSPFQLVI